MTFEGIVKKVFPVQEGTSKNGNTWRKQEAVIEEVGVQYPQSVCVSQMGDTIDRARLVEGHRVKAMLTIKTNEYNGRVFNSINCWAVEDLDHGQPVTGSNVIPPNAPIAPPPIVGQNDDLPF